MIDFLTRGCHCILTFGRFLVCARDQEMRSLTIAKLCGFIPNMDKAGLHELVTIVADPELTAT